MDDLNPSDRHIGPVRQWFEENYDEHPSGIDQIDTNRDGTKIVLSELFDTGRFKELLRQHDQYEPEVHPDGSISVLKVEKPQGGTIYKHAIGVSFHKTGFIPLGGYKEPILPTGEPKDETVKETLELLTLYLEDKYGD